MCLQGSVSLYSPDTRGRDRRITLVDGPNDGQHDVREEDALADEAIVMVLQDGSHQFACLCVGEVASTLRE